jgi:hypothetical protein
MRRIFFSVFFIFCLCGSIYGLPVDEFLNSLESKVVRLERLRSEVTGTAGVAMDYYLIGFYLAAYNVCMMNNRRDWQDWIYPYFLAPYERLGFPKDYVLSTNTYYNLGYTYGSTIAVVPEIKRTDLPR